MTAVRLLAIVCVVFAGVQLASADTAPPIFPLPSATPTPPPAAPPAPPPAPAAPPVKPAAQAKLDRAAAEQQCAEQSPQCDWFATLGGLERQSMRRALVARGYEIEPQPWGKVVGAIRVYNEDVFAEKTRLLRFFNTFHVTSKEHVVRAEVILRPGEVWDQKKVEETARRLRDPIFTSVIAVVPVKSREPGKVDVLVVTRDIWSLRFNTTYTYQSGRLTDLGASISENNFLGRRVLIAATMQMNQGSIQTGPLFLDKNFLGKHLYLRVSVNAILNRGALLGTNIGLPGTPGDPDQIGRTSSFDIEGSNSSITLSRPLWSLATKWATGITVSHGDEISRRFFGTHLRPVWCPLGGECVRSISRSAMPAPGSFNPELTPIDEQLPWNYRVKRLGANMNAVRSFGTDFKQNVTVGYDVDRVNVHLLDTFPGLVEQREPFARAVLPRSEVTSVPYAAYGAYTPRFKTRRNVTTYDLAEDVRIGPSFDASIGIGLKALGSTYNFRRGSISGAWTFPWCRDGSITLSAGIATRHQDGEFIDNAASWSLRLVSPVYWRARLVAESTFGTRWNDTTNALLTIGSDNGLRGFSINEFAGQRLTGSQIEVRSLPYAFWVFRLGGVLFYDVGGAADTFRELQLHHDVGIGLRSLIPQTSRELFRFDLAFPLDGPSAGKPKFIAGFRSEF